MQDTPSAGFGIQRSISHQKNDALPKPVRKAILTFDAWLTGKRTRVYSSLVVSLMVVFYVAMMFIGDFPFDAYGDPFAVDFSAQITAGKIALDGGIDQLYDIQLQRDVQRGILPGLDPDYLNIFISPPVVAFIYAPFAALPYFPAALIWTCVSFGFFLIGIRLYWPLAGSLRTHGFRRVALVALSAPPLLECLESGQDATLSFLLLVVGFRLHLDRRDFRAGAVLGLGMFKPQLFLLFFVYFAARRRWRALFGYSAAGSALAFVSIALIGFEGVSTYLRLLTSDLYVMGIAEPLNWNMQSLSALMHSFTPRSLRMTVDVTLLLAGAAAVWFISKSRVCERKSARDIDALSFAGTVLTTALVDPHFFLYDCTILLLPALILLARKDVTPMVRASIGAMYISTLVAPMLHKAHALPTPLDVIDTQWSVVPVAALLVMIWRTADRLTSGSDEIGISDRMGRNGAHAT